jgi:uncharacterized protein HemY
VLITAGNWRKQGKQCVALQVLDNHFTQDRVENLNSNPETSAVYYYLSGRLLKETNHFTEAQERLQKCVSLRKQVSSEIYAIPHSLMELADIHLRLGQKEEAINSLQEAKQFKSYDFDKPNLRRIMRLMDQAQSCTGPTSASMAANE